MHRIDGIKKDMLQTVQTWSSSGNYLNNNVFFSVITQPMANWQGIDESCLQSNAVLWSSTVHEQHSRRMATALAAVLQTISSQIHYK